MSRRIPLYIAAVALIALSAGVIYFIGKQSGQKAGEQTKTRLELVWPSFMALPEIDRAVLASFALTCHLDQKPAEAAGVIACLREAAADPDSIKPKGMGKAEAAARLEGLISQAQGNNR